MNTKWVIYCVTAFFATGFIGVMQKVHQNSEHKEELFVFLASAFIVSFIYAYAQSRIKKSVVAVDVRFAGLAGIVGVCAFLNNFLNLKLSGVMPSQVFFPIVNGVPILSLTLCSKVFFKEKLSKRQIAGLFGGALSIIAICFL